MNEGILAVLIVSVVLSGMVLRHQVSALDRRLNRLARVEAKIDALLKGAGITFDAFQDVPADVREALESGQTILAIKRFRQATGADLKEAKEFVDEVRRRQSASRTPEGRA